MKKELKDYLHLYLGCQMKTSEGEIVTLISVNRDGSAFARNDSLQCHGFLSDTKLILRPLSDINDKEARECWFASGIGGQVTNYKHALTGYYFPDCTVYQMSLITNWLRENWFDIDGLILADLAIDKTTL